MYPIANGAKNYPELKDSRYVRFTQLKRLTKCAGLLMNNTNKGERVVLSALVQRNENVSYLIQHTR
ncbi:MAG TPA: hypothetical protein VE467_04275 [Chryseolinea sp.]|nr:hypothetical protein [Chryseolinea sp.]